MSARFSCVTEIDLLDEFAEATLYLDDAGPVGWRRWQLARVLRDRWVIERAAALDDLRDAPQRERRIAR